MSVHRYGEAAEQFAELHLPAGTGPHPLAVLVHGGFWRPPYGLSLMTPLARSLAAHGWAAWNVEYRRIGQRGGGWPGTLADVAAAVDAVASVAEPAGLDLTRVVGIGHSAGGHLALWLAARAGLPAGAPGSGPAVELRGAVSQAGVADLVRGNADGLGAGAVAELLGGDAGAVPDRYALASPQQRLPLGVRQLLVHGDADDQVPVTQSRAYATAARDAGDEVELRELRGVDHFEVIDPAHPAWGAVLTGLHWLSGTG